MKAAVPFRIAAVLLILFAAGHTYGFLHFQPPTAEAMAVRAAMTNVTFHVGGREHSYADFYRGFGLFVTAYLLFAAVLAWELPRLLVSARDSFRVLSWAFLAVQVASVALCGIFFAAPQALFSMLVALCIAAGIHLARSP
jgi:hypothetical protein